MYIDKDQNIINGETAQDRLLRRIYSSRVLRLFIKPFTYPGFSKAAGKFLDSPLSKFLIKPFIKSNNIDMRDYKADGYRSFNGFFTRKINPGARKIDDAKIISPSDGKVSAYKIDASSVFEIKNSKYCVASLLRSRKLAEKFMGGTAVVIRLCVDDYHRYCYALSGTKGEDRKISGFLHTVNPAAFDAVSVFCENSREYCVIKSDETLAVQMEVGALMVGKITNLTSCPAKVTKGEEKGYFEFGGSTIVLLLQEGVEIRGEFLENTRLGLETLVSLGDPLSID